MRKPKSRKERFEFLRSKMGDLVIHLIAPMTDRELKPFFEEMYLLYKDREDYIKPEYKNPDCLVCGSETIITWDCACGHAIIDDQDSALEELKKSGEYERIRQQYMK